MRTMGESTPLAAELLLMESAYHNGAAGVLSEATGESGRDG